MRSEPNQSHSALEAVHAIRLFGAGALLLLLGAAMGLNAWPAHRIFAAAGKFSVGQLYDLLRGYGLIFLVLFWGSRPTARMQWAALVPAPIVTWSLWQALDEKNHFFQLGQSGFPNISEILNLITSGLALPAACVLLLRLASRPTQLSDRSFESRLKLLTCLVLLFTIVPEAALTLTATLHPMTFDLYAMRWDHAAGLGFTPAIIDVADAIPGARQLLLSAYSMTPLGFAAVALRHLRGRPQHVPDAVLTWVVLTSCALLAYNFFPITGPKYVFGSDGYAAALARHGQAAIELIKVASFPRNGMPSMHFGWMLASAVLWWQSGAPRWSRILFAVLASLTAVSTLYVGEHYVVDLIVAVPFVLAALALSSTSVPWTYKPRVYAVLTGFGAWVVWVIALRTFMPWLAENGWACWMMIAVTASAVYFQAKCLATFRSAALPADQEVTSVGLTGDSFGRKLGAMFFASGMAALVYQVLFAKRLALVFGSTATATFTVLATFLGGMAIGSLIGSRIAQRAKRPLQVYAYVELLIAVYCLATPLLFDSIQTAYVAAATGQPPGAPILLLFRVALGAAVLLVPTVLMGATLPLLTQVMSGQKDPIGAQVAWLYFVNTAGAATGALCTSYFIIPLVGVRSTTLVAAVLNMLVALGALELAKKAIPVAATAAVEHSSFRPATRRAVIAALVSLGVTGVLSLGLEVVYVHMLSIVAGNSVYAFGLMLATFLIGLAIGGEGARRLLLNAQNDRVQLLAWSLTGFAIAIALSVWWWNEIPEYFGSFANYPVATQFAAREAIRGLVCALLMIPPTVFIGSAYAFSMDLITSRGDGKAVAMLGVGASLNTLGNISGVLIFGFVLLPLLGGLVTTRIVALGALSTAIAVFAIAAPRIRRRDLGLAGGALAIIAASFAVRLDYESLSSGSNVYFYPQKWGTVIDHAESIDGGLTTVVRTSAGGSQFKTLLTNGKFQGNDSWKGEMQAQLGFALASLLHQDARDRALVIGYGTGVTSRAFHEAGFRQLDIAELSRDMVRMADAHFATVNNRVSSAPGVNLHITDGRNLLLLTPDKQRYDVVSIEITSIWFAGAASLYNNEFYSLVRSRMSERGVLQQWVQLHHLEPLDILSIVASLRSEFRYVSLYVMGGQGILIATNDPSRKDPVRGAIEKLEGTLGLEPLKVVLNRPIAELQLERMLDSDGIDRFISGVGGDGRIWWSTDDNLSLEYSTPKGNVNSAELSYVTNLQLLSRYKQK
ncbi:hypothetical protein E4K72_07405 [Oxalobacteraceae bacterium OM1]|nr:hypothetical protein E4K72_07405 [Oxalobacteraceae bacterium OM1]